MGRNPLDLIDQEFGSLKVVELLPDITRHGSRIWWCRCICGRGLGLTSTQLQKGRPSCGLCEPKKPRAKRRMKFAEFAASLPVRR